MKLVLIATSRYSINACDYDLLYRNSPHQIVKVLYHQSLKKKRWLRTGKPCPGNRNGISTALLDHPHKAWKEHRDLLDKLSDIDFDCICLGNISTTGEWLKERLNCKFLHSEYGWLPWKECFFIDDQGVGPKSSLMNIDIDQIKVTKRSDEIKRIKHQFNTGKAVPFKQFVYVPLQVDTPTSDGKKDFKFNYTRFGSNREFLFKVKEIVPSTYTILVKSHPAAKKPTPVPHGMVDISDMKLNKYELYNRMEAMICMNSTSAIEGMLFEKPVFAYGRDVFSNKRLAYENIDQRKQFIARMQDRDRNLDRAKKFVNLLLERQVYRHRCSDPEYVKNHYWVRQLP